MKTIAAKGVFLSRIVYAAALTIIVCSGCSKKADVPLQKIGLAIPAQHQPALVYIASVNGYLRDEGLDVVFLSYTHGKAALEALLEGKADLATAGETPMMLAALRGENIRLIATIFSTNKDESIVARKDMGVLSPSDLKGKKIGVSKGTTGHFFLDTFLIAHNLSIKDIRPIYMKPEAMAEKIREGEVDAAATWYPWSFGVQQQLGENAVTFYGETLYTKTHNLFAKGDFLEKNPDTVKRLLRALLRAEKFIREKPAESIRIMADILGIDKASLERVWKASKFHVTLDQFSLINLENQARWAIKNGMTEMSEVPNFLAFTYLEGLSAVKPQAVTIIR